VGRVPAAEKAVGLPWLRPTVAGLLALSDTPPDRDAVLDCPGTVAHILRYARPTPDPSNLILSPELLSLPGVSLAAAEFVERCWPADWTLGDGRALLVGRTAARVAAALAADTNLCAADAAWAAALLSPLGWYAAGSVPDAAAVGRRLAFRWRMPTPFAVTVGSLALDPGDVAPLGGHPGLHRVVRAAVTVAERRHGSLVLSDARPDSELDAVADRVADSLRESASTRGASRPPDTHPKLLAKLLRLSAAARQRSGVAVVADLEAQIDALTRRVVEARSGFDAAVRDAKLLSLAEFAAGAGHEINNPLAVVSGNAQLLLSGEGDPDRRRRLDAVIRSAGRIHDILIGIRQFARPPAPTPAVVLIAETIHSACQAQRPSADERGIAVEISPSPDALWVRADAMQLRQVVGNLVRNGVEAAPAGGWVRVAVEAVGDRIVVAVEDNGPGPLAVAVSHLFDPFYSGRDAGRGRGLGLAQAWQLARQNGGAVVFAPRPGGPTRFTLTLPAAEPSSCRRSA
jgi:two-component system NtrC family sensor kinase